MPLTSSDRILLNLALKALADGELNEDDRTTFSRDHRQYKADQLTFRELVASIKSPKGELKNAMQSYYGRSIYKRVFKGK